MAIEKIEITINDNTSGDNTGTAKDTNTIADPVSKQNKNTQITKNQIALFRVVQQAGNTIVNYGLSNYGNFTGDYVTQARINRAVNNFQTGSSIALTFALGGPIAGVASLSAFGVGAVLQEVSRQNDIRKQDSNAIALRERTGINTKEGSR